MDKEWILGHGKAVVLLAIVFFFSMVRYVGYEADAGIYLLQVVNYLYPERFVNDVPFMFGNQDSFTLFSPFMAFFFKTFGVNLGGIIVTFLFEALWCFGAFFFISKWAKYFHFERWSSVVFFVFIVLLVKTTYDCGFFRNLLVAEYYLVGRFMAAAIALWALGLFWGRSKYLSLALFVLATLMHPLTAGWGIVLWVLYYFPKTRWLVITCAVALPFLAFLHWGKFDFYSDDWLGRPLIYAPNLGNGLVYAGFLVFWLVMALRLKNIHAARYSRCMFLMCLIGFTLQYVAGYAEHIFLYQVQPFRVQWICIVSIVPILALFWSECANDDGLKIRIPSIVEKVLFAVGFVFFVVMQSIGNIVGLSFEQNVGSMSWALALIDVPEKMEPFGRCFLVLLMVVCFIEKRYWLTFAFIIALCHSEIKILPLIAIVLFLIPSVSPVLQKILVTFGIVGSFAEMLLHLPGSPLLDNALGSMIFFLLLFVFMLWLLLDLRGKMCCVPLALFLVTIGAWDFVKWDSRTKEHALIEKQMDSLFERPLFPQVKNRGGILFADCSSPIQSRINFLTGAYADATIGVGEVFFKEQYILSNRRQSFMQYGTPDEKGFPNYQAKMKEIFDNRDLLLDRMSLLCGLGEIEYLATDHGDLPVNKVDSVFLNMEERWFWLYSCEGE